MSPNKTAPNSIATLAEAADIVTRDPSTTQLLWRYVIPGSLGIAILPALVSLVVLVTFTRTSSILEFGGWGLYASSAVVLVLLFHTFNRRQMRSARANALGEFEWLASIITEPATLDLLEKSPTLQDARTAAYNWRIIANRSNVSTATLRDAIVLAAIYGEFSMSLVITQSWQHQLDSADNDPRTVTPTVLDEMLKSNVMSASQYRSTLRRHLVMV